MARREMQRREFIQNLAMGTAVMTAGSALTVPTRARACAGYDDVVALGTPVDIGELASVKVTCLSGIGWWSNAQFQADMAAGGGSAASQYLTAWDRKNAAGCALYIEATECDGTSHTVLVDTGWNTDYMRWVFLREGKAEELRHRLVERVILTHEHLDHFWGLPALCELDRKVPLYVPGTLTDAGKRLIAEGRHRGPVVPVQFGTAYRHFPGFATALLDFTPSLGIHGEQILYFNVKDRGLVVVTGCCHPGASAAISFATTYLACGGDFYGLYGGLHLSPFGAPLTAAALGQISAIEAAGFEVIACNHCTGLPGVMEMRNRGLPVVSGTARFGSKNTEYVGCGDSMLF